MIDQAVIPPHTHYGLAFQTPILTRTGSFIRAVPKIIWHTTESPSGKGTSAMEDVLHSKSAEVHFVIDPIKGVVRQLVRLDEFGKGVEHPPNTPDTNRAHCIQIEICAYSAHPPNSPHEIHNLAALALLIEHRVPVRRIADLPFTQAGGHRVKPENWAGAHGHFGHQHVPSQPSGHTDPGALDIHAIFDHMGRIARDS